MLGYRDYFLVEGEGVGERIFWMVVGLEVFLLENIIDFVEKDIRVS